jgi:hypothetical protein
LAAGLLGCGKSDGPGNRADRPAASRRQTAATATTATTAAGATTDDPAAAVARFLEAVRTGNDEWANGMLSATARKKMSQLGPGLTPPASDTARFEVGKVDYIAHDGARVDCTWTDLDESGKPESRHSLWVVRRENEGWRVVGVAATVFEGEPPLLLNFEDPEDVLKKQQWLRAEIVRRSQAEKNPEKAGETPGDTIRR